MDNQERQIQPPPQRMFVHVRALCVLCDGGFSSDVYITLKVGWAEEDWTLAFFTAPPLAVLLHYQKGR
jgi:hypothetical protein